MKRRIAEVLVGLACVCLLADTGYAQVTLAAIRGKATDEQGAARQRRARAAGDRLVGAQRLGAAAGGLDERGGRVRGCGDRLVARW